MDNNLLHFAKDYAHIIAAVIAGTFAITAAYIRRDRRHEKPGSGGRPILGLLLPPLLALLIGGALLAAENYGFNTDPDGGFTMDNPGAILSLTGCVFLAAGVLWLFVNFFRPVTWPARVPAAGDDTQVKSTPVAGTRDSRAPLPVKKPAR